VKSTGGKHFIGLDQIRAFAAFLVFVWHFRGRSSGAAIPLPGSFDFFGFSIFTEGHTGVGLFMVLSGYLFVRLTEGRELLIRPFLYNRLLRLAPLLIAVMLLSMLIAGFTHALPAMATDLLKGFVWPTWPSGGWSITIEAHFYLLFPLLLFLLRTRPYLLLGAIVCSVATRIGVYELLGTHVERLAYQTIFGRIDQFVVGMLMGQFGAFMARRHLVALATGVLFLWAWQQFVRYGGFEGTHNDAKAWVWIWIPLIEACAYGILIAYYDRSFQPPSTGISGVIGRIGEWSYSIYLLHQFFVGFMANTIDRHVIHLGNFYLLLAFSIPCFALTCLVARFTYEYFEKPFLRRRRPYLGGRSQVDPPPPPVVATAP
jgi:rhamnosyltransferase